MSTLPAAYTLAGLGDGWDRLLRETLRNPPRRGTGELPAPVSPGRLGRWLPATGLVFALRRWRNRIPPPRDPGDEWPNTLGGR